MIIVEINELENEISMSQFNETKSYIFERINRIDKPPVTLNKKKKKEKKKIIHPEHCY